MKRKILIVDDERENCESLKRIFELEGYECLMAQNGKEALALLSTVWIHVTFLDIRMPGEDGISLLQKIKNLFPEVEVIMMTAYGTIETAVKAMKIGAYDFVTKPLERQILIKTAEKAFEKQNLIIENKVLKSKLQSFESLSEMIGESEKIRSIIRTAHQVAPSDSSLLIEGETGCGKEILAHLIVQLSNRKNSPFIKINCAALSENLLESELFGHEKGAFTGAHQLKKGLFEIAHGGTIFLDEIAELSRTIAAKLLRITQDGEFTRLGSSHPLKTNVRIISATNKNLKKLVDEKKFREDLFYRLNVVHIEIPPLRERKEDIALLVTHFIKVYNKKMNKKITGITKNALQMLMDYNWPGNIRELQNVIERTVLLSKEDILTPQNLPAPLNTHEEALTALTIPLGTPLEEVETKLIERALKASKGDKKAAAHLLGIHERTIYRKLRK